MRRNPLGKLIKVRNKEVRQSRLSTLEKSKEILEEFILKKDKLTTHITFECVYMFDQECVAVLLYVDGKILSSFPLFSDFIKLLDYMELDYNIQLVEINMFMMKRTVSINIKENL